MRARRGDVLACGGDTGQAEAGASVVRRQRGGTGKGIQRLGGLAIEARRLAQGEPDIGRLREARAGGSGQLERTSAVALQQGQAHARGRETPVQRILACARREMLRGGGEFARANRQFGLQQGVGGHWCEWCRWAGQFVGRRLPFPPRDQVGDLLARALAIFGMAFGLDAEGADPLHALGGIGDDALDRRLARLGQRLLAVADRDAAVFVAETHLAVQHGERRAAGRIHRHLPVGAVDRGDGRRRLHPQRTGGLFGLRPGAALAQVERSAGGFLLLLQLEDAVGVKAHLDLGIDHQRHAARRAGAHPPGRFEHGLELGGAPFALAVRPVFALARQADDLGQAGAGSRCGQATKHRRQQPA